MCDGVAVLAAATDDPARLAQLGVSAQVVKALQDLAADVDAAGDLQVADAILGLVRGRPADVAGTTAAPPASASLPPSTSCARPGRGAA